ncbi:MAG: ribosomal RNA small subunit methyltransferase A [Candidatus Nomurabacteria bacterium]|nr:ribosomal RNA small subunit methyltransferase A [Candidatus Nomurabacteria bacterium]USN87454.1 MAG: ribosomal RNA small subunit methyltransferase A [Candidatus Nomurabacteria bacterium]
MNRSKGGDNGVENQSDKFVHKKSLGQNFLTSDVVPRWMCEAAKLEADDVVLEIGPGTGMLTRAILAHGARVIAIEADQRAVESLNNTFTDYVKEQKLTIIHGDVREVTPNNLGLKDHGFKVIANIPYYLSGYLLRQLLETDIQPINLTFLIQKELAERIARDAKESILSLSVKAFGSPVYIKTVTKGHFNPKPRVDSAILSIYDINRDSFQALDLKLFFRLVHLGLGNKRKQLLSNLSREYDRPLLTSIFSSLSIPGDVRGEDLSIEIWLRLAKELSTSRNVIETEQ